MNFSKRGFIGLTRNSRKYVLVFGVIFVLGNLMALGLMIRSSVDLAGRGLLSSVPPVVTLEWNLDLAHDHFENTGEWPPFTSLSLEDIQRAADFQGVDSYHLSSVTALFSEEVIQAPIPYEDGMILDENNLESKARGIRFAGRPYDLFTEIRGIDDASYFTDSPIISLISGRSFNPEELAIGANKAIISQEFAQANHLEVGGSFIMANKVFDVQELKEAQPHDWEREQFNPEFLAAQESITFEVIGIFEVEADLDLLEAGPAGRLNIELAHRLINRIYLPNETVLNINDFQAQHLQDIIPQWESYPVVNHWVGEFLEFFTLFPERRQDLEVIFFLTEADLIPEFEDWVKESLPAPWEVKSLSEQFLDFSQSLENLEWIFDWVLIASLAGGAGLMMLLVLLLLADRKYEVGIYRALGEARWKFSAQFLSEIWISSALALLAVIPSSVFLGRWLGHRLLQHQLLLLSQVNPEAEPSLGVHGPLNLQLFSSSTFSPDEFLDLFQIRLNLQTLWLIFLSCLLIVTIAALIPLSYYAKQKPQKLLQKSSL